MLLLESVAVVSLLLLVVVVVMMMMVDGEIPIEFKTKCAKYIISHMDNTLDLRYLLQNTGKLDTFVAHLAKSEEDFNLMKDEVGDNKQKKWI